MSLKSLYFLNVRFCSILFVFLCLFLTFNASQVYADGDEQCIRTGTGDVQCPSSTQSYDLNIPPIANPSNPATGGSVLGSGSPIFSGLGNQSGGGILQTFQGLFDGLSTILRNVLVSSILNVIDTGGSNGVLQNLANIFTQIQPILDSIANTNGSDIGAFAQSVLAQMISQNGAQSLGNVQQILNSLNTAIGGQGIPGLSGNVLPIDTNSVGGKKIAECAGTMIGHSTADVASTQGGALGCALAVSRILDCAGYGVGTHVSTVALYNALDSDPCYQKVDEGHITGADAMGLQPGDVLVTKRGSRAGHTGIYEGNGNIISNSSRGFQGSARGTIQRNYTVDRWKSVTDRNPGGSAVFRRVCD